VKESPETANKDNKSPDTKAFFSDPKLNSSPDKDGDTTTHEMKYIFSPGGIDSNHDTTGAH
jgi:hypothetical protein